MQPGRLDRRYDRTRARADHSDRAQALRAPCCRQHGTALIALLPVTLRCKLRHSKKRIPVSAAMTLRHLSATLCAGVLMAASATIARADDWDDCRTEIPDKVMAGCTAVIELHALKDEDLATAHRRRGAWYGRRGRTARA